MKISDIPYARQSVAPQDVDAVVAVLKSDFLTQGPAIARFETALAEYCGAKHAIVVSNATAALHLACLAAGLRENERVWTSPNTFVASANCALYCGARPDFVDIDPRTYNLSVTALGEKLVAAEKTGSLPKIVIPVHFAGQSCDMAALRSLSRKYGFKVIEDASHAIGGSYREQKIGSCEFSDMAVLSFHPVKIITTGEGGAVLTNDPDLHQKLMLLRSHGVTRDPALMRDKSDGPWAYQQVALGFNYRMTDIQAALGLSQLTRLDSFIERRRGLTKRYSQLFSKLPLTTPWEHPECRSAQHLYVIRVNPSKTGPSRRAVYDKLHADGIRANVHYIPVHTQPYYRDLGFRVGDFPEAERYYSEAISLPLYYGLDDESQDRVAAALSAAFD